MKESHCQGLLIMAANSLGLTEDIPQRSLQAVKKADLLIFEEDKPACRVLKTAGIHRAYLKYNKQGQKDTLEAVRQNLLDGKTVVYMSDQGCPTLEDPGFEVLRTARTVKARIQVIPGPSSLTAALSACPFSNKSFDFLGFPPREESLRKDFFKKISGKNNLQIIMDTPYRLKKVLETCMDVFPDAVKAYVALDISGEDENYIFGTFKQIYKDICTINKRLNFVLIIQPAKSENLQKHPRYQRKKNKY